MKEIEVKPSRARGLGVITPTLKNMQIEYPNINYQDVRVKRTQGEKEQYYRGIYRHTMNLNPGNMETEIKIPRSTVFFTDESPYQDSLDLDVVIKNTDIHVSQGKLDLYITRETGSDENPNIIMHKILVHSMDIHSNEQIQLLITDLDHWDWVVSAMKALHLNPYTGYTLYAEYRDDKELFQPSMAKSKIGVISYDTKVHSTIRFIQGLNTTLRKIETTGVTGYVDPQSNAYHVGLDYEEDRRKFAITYDLYGYTGNLLNGLNVDVLVTDYENYYTIQVPRRDSSGNVLTDENDNILYTEQTFSPGQRIDSFGTHSPLGGTVDTQSQVTQIQGREDLRHVSQGKWEWVMPEYFLTDTGSTTHLVRVDFVVGRNSQTYYGSKNPLTGETEHPNMDSRYGSVWTFWIDIETTGSSGSGAGLDD